MKKSIIIIALLFFAISLAQAQNIHFSTYIEATHVTPKSGFNLRYVDPYGWEVGIFHQESKLLENVMSLDQDRQLPRFYEKTFSGVLLTFPMMERERFDLKFNVRTGVVNNEIFVITPAVLANLKIAPFLHLGGGIGTRAFRPTLITNLTVRI